MVKQGAPVSDSEFCVYTFISCRKKIMKNNSINNSQNFSALNESGVDEPSLHSIKNKGSFLAILLEMQRKVNEIHKLHFSEQYLSEKIQLKEKFLAEILISPARNVKRKTKNLAPHDQ